MNTQTEREKFEAWAKHFHYDLKRMGPEYVNEPYANEGTDWSWLAWQAARASLAQGDAAAPAAHEAEELSNQLSGISGLLPVRDLLDEAERRDAERYRWLRENFIRVTLLPEQTFWQFVGSLAGDNWRGGLDAAIDAAIVASKGEPK